MRVLRIMGVTVQPILVWDEDGELAPGPGAQPVVLALADLAGHRERLVREVEAMNAQAGQP